MQSSLHRFRIAKPTAADGEGGDSSTTKEYSRRSETDPRSPRPHASCVRCRRVKRKCSRTIPHCTLCLSSGSKCSLSDATTMSPAQVQQLIDRVERLSNKFDGDMSAINTVSGLLTSANPPESIDASADRVIEGTTLESREILSTGGSASAVTEDVLAPTQAVHIPRRIPREAAGRQFVDAYFRHIHRAYPFMDKTTVMQDVENMGVSIDRLETMSTKLYMIMAIGYTTLRRPGQVSDELAAKFKISHHTILADCLAKENIDSVETLLLLGLQALFEPSGLSPWVITGALARQVMTMGLSRKTSPTQEHQMSLHQIEMRHRLYWSIYTFDRMVSASLGLPFGINDLNTNVPLPGVTLEEYATTERQYYTLTLQVNRHIIALRQLEEQILSTIHLASYSKTSTLSQSDRRIIIQDLRAQIENWYTQGCLVTPMERDQIPFHNTIPWLNLRYQNLLLLLYTPSHFNTPISQDHLGEIQRAAQKYIQFSAVLFQQRHLPLNWVTLYRFIALCPVLLYCMVRDERGAYTANEELVRCVEVLEAFGERWTDARRTAGVFRRLVEWVSGAGDFAEAKRDVERLVGEVLGESSVYTMTFAAVEEIERGRASTMGYEQSQIPTWADVQLRSGMMESTSDPWVGLDDMIMVLV